MLEFFLAATPSVDAAIIGYTGIFNVPTAEVRDDVVISFRWLEAPMPDLILANPDTGTVNRMYTMAMPLLPLVEISAGALSIDGWPDSAFTIVPNGFHRAISAKARTPREWPLPALAIGTIDPFSANEFAGRPSSYGLKNYYAVCTQQIGPVAVSAGWGLGDRLPDRGYRQAPFLDGPFGGVVWAFPLGLELLGEWDGHAPNYGVRWAAPWGLSAQWGRLGAGFTAGIAIALEL